MARDEVWVIINWDTIDPGSVLLAIHATEDGARRHIDREVADHPHNVIGSMWGRAQVERMGVGS